MLKISSQVPRQLRLHFVCVWIACAALRLTAQSDQTIYTDSLQNGWENWGWATLDYNQTSVVHSGTKSASVTFINNTYQAIYLHHVTFDSSAFTNLTF